MSALRLSLFGELRVAREGTDVTAALPGRQGRALLAFLALRHPSPVRRDELLAVLWPGAAPAAPEAALASVLAKVRRVLPGLVAGREALSLDLPADAELDVREAAEAPEEAERLLAAGDATGALEAAGRALAILGRPLLPGLQGEWLEPWRARAAELEQRALEASARAALALGPAHAPAAERAAAALVAAQPYREAGHALLMQAQAARGDVAEALRTFERLRVLLREELGAAPSAAVVELHGRLLRDGAAPPPPPVPAPPPAPAAAPATTAAAAPSAADAADGAGPERLPLPAITATTLDGAFVGRADDLERLRERWEESRGGQTRLVLLVGEAGVGKTRLAARLAQEVHREGAAVLYGRADEEALLPYQPFVEALRHVLAHGGPAFAEGAARERGVLRRILPDLADPAPEAGGAGDDDTLRYRLFEAVVALLTRASRRWPVLLVLDDLHWADKPTLLLLRHLLRHPELARLLVVGTFRHVEVGRDHPLVDLLTDLRRERRYDRVALGGLDEEETRALVLDRLPTDVTPGFVARLREQTEGNAFFLEETLRALEDAGLPEARPLAEGDLERLGVPEGVAEVVSRRVRHLSPLAAEVLTAASVLGREFRLGVVEQLVDAGAERVMLAVEECLAAGLVLELPERPDRFAFAHALVREVLYGELTASRRVRLHHRVAEALEALAGAEAQNPAELAHHFHLARHIAGPGPARRYAIAAGQRASDLLAYEEAVGHFRRALALFGDDDEAARCDVLLALGRVQWHAGDDEARSTFLSAADSAALRGDAPQLARAALGLGERWWEAGYLGSRYRELLSEAAAAIGPDDSALHALVLARLAENLGFPFERERGMELSAQAVAMARRLGDDDLLFACLLARHAALLDVRHLDERLAIGEELDRLEGAHRELSAELHQWRLYDLLEAGDLEAARREQVQLDGLARELRQPVLQSVAVGWRGIWAELDGDVELAERCAEESLRHGQRAHLRDAVSTWAAKLFGLRRRQGRLAELTPVVERLARGGARRSGWLSALALLRLETGDEAGARALFERELADGAAALPRGMFWLTNVALLAELAAGLRDVPRARELHALLAPHADRNVTIAYAAFWGPVERHLALLAATWGDEAQAARHLAAARARVEAMGAPLLLADLERPLPLPVG